MFGEEPDTSFVATGWDSVMLLADAVRKTGTTDSDNIAGALEEGEFKFAGGRVGRNDFSSA
jgi:branched-chain amino acid transport system substrate-binding protein